MSKGQVLETVISIHGQMSDSVRKSVKDVQKQLSLIDSGAVKTAAKLGAIATAAGAAVGAVAYKFIDFGNDFTRTMNSIQAQTGASAEDMKEFSNIAKDLYAGGKGESIQEVADALTNISQNSNLAGEDLKEAANASLMLKDTFGMDTAETTRAATQLMKQFGMSAEEAYGMIAIGAQSGANKNGDLLDTINEYSVHFKDLGLNSDQMMNALIKGAESGAFSIDKMGDAIKEFGIRSKDGSKTSAEGFALLGLDAETMTAQFAAGGRTAENAFDQVIKALEAVEDPVERNAAGVALFGTMFEDLGPDAIKAFGQLKDGAFDGKKALEELEKVKYNDLGYAISQIGRQFEVSLIPSAEKAGQAVYAHMPEIQAALSQVTPHIAALGEAFASALPGIIETMASVGGVLVSFATTIVDNWSYIEPVLWGIGAGLASIKIAQFAAEIGTVIKSVKAAGGALTFFASPLGMVALAIGAVVAIGVALYKNWDTISAKASEVGEWIAGKWTAMKDSVSNTMSGLWTSMTEKWDAITGTVRNAVTYIGDFVGGIWTKIKDGAASIGDVIKNHFQMAFESIPTILKAPINGAIMLINGAIDAINGIGFTVPSWIPGIGGEAFTVDIPKIPMLASGGFTDGPSIAGEAGTEAVISFDPAYREENIGYLTKAAKMLGVSYGLSDVDQAVETLDKVCDILGIDGSGSARENSIAYFSSLIDSFGGYLAHSIPTSYNLGGLNFAPNITVSGIASAGADGVQRNIMELLKEYQGDLLDMIEELLEAKEAAQYGAKSVF